VAGTAGSDAVALPPGTAGAVAGTDAAAGNAGSDAAALPPGTTDAAAGTTGSDTVPLAAGTTGAAAGTTGSDAVVPFLFKERRKLWRWGYLQRCGYRPA
jgi:hypothetical protein